MDFIRIITPTPLYVISRCYAILYDTFEYQLRISVARSARLMFGKIVGHESDVRCLLSTLRRALLKCECYEAKIAYGCHVVE